jgi:hypothetical protein
VPPSQVLGIAGAVGALLYVMLDSGIVRSEGAPKVMSVSLLVLALLFTVGAWTAGFGNKPARRPMLTGLALGLASYAVLRLFAF